MSNSGTEYLLGSFRLNSASASGRQDDTMIHGWGAYGNPRVHFEGVDV